MVDQVSIAVKDLQAFTEKVVARLSIVVHANLVAAPSEGGTPVDLGWARANWVPKIGSAFTGLSGQRPTGDRKTRAGQLAVSALVRVAATYRLRQGPVFISNNVPYIGVLNEGHSKQAPAGFVQRAIVKAVSSVAAAPPRL